MKAKIKALEVELSEEKQMRQDKEQEVGHYSVLFDFILYCDKSNSVYFVKPKRAPFEPIS